MNPRLIRLLASQYRELQGLKTIADAAFLFYFAALLTLARSGWDVVLGFAIAGGLGWVRFTWLRERIETFYESRCGRTDWRARPLGHTFLFFTWVCLGAGTTVMAWPPALRAVVLIAALAGLPILIAVRDAPYRLHWLLPALVGVAAAIVHGTVTTRTGGDAWEIRVLIIGGVAIALAGLGDHLLLTRTLGGSASTDVVAAGEA